jgi:hypothetical protein
MAAGLVITRCGSLAASLAHELERTFWCGGFGRRIVFGSSQKKRTAAEQRALRMRFNGAAQQA